MKIYFIIENYEILWFFVSNNFKNFKTWNKLLNFKDFMLDEMHRRKVEKDIADLKKLIGNYHYQI